jgi:hypothetical protein
MALLALTGAVLMTGGLAAALWFAAAPRHVQQVVERPVLMPTGEFGLTLVPTGATKAVTVTRVCVSVRRVLWPAGEDAACRDGDARDLGFAGLGAGAFVAGAVAWAASGAERRLWIGVAS